MCAVRTGIYHGDTEKKEAGFLPTVASVRGHVGLHWLTVVQSYSGAEGVVQCSWTFAILI